MEAKKLLNDVMVELNCEEMLNIDGGKKDKIEVIQDIAKLYHGIMTQIFDEYPNCVSEAYDLNQALKGGQKKDNSKPTIGFGCTAR